jgi:hypothetical protein
MSAEKAVLAGIKPVIKMVVDAERRIDALEGRSTSVAANEAAANITRAADDFLVASLPVSKLPHIEARLKVYLATGARPQDYLPEVGGDE